MKCPNCPSGELIGEASLIAENCVGPVRFESGPADAKLQSKVVCRAEAAVTFEEMGSFRGLRIVNDEPRAEEEDVSTIIDLRIKHAVEMAFFEVGIAGA